MGFGSGPHALLCTPPGVGGCGRWGGSSPGSASASGLRPHQARSLPNPSHQGVGGQCWGWGARGSGFPLSRRFPPHQRPPPRLLLPSGPHLAGSVGGWSDPRNGVIRGSSPVVCGLSRQAGGSSGKLSVRQCAVCSPIVHGLPKGQAGIRPPAVLPEPGPGPCVLATCLLGPGCWPWGFLCVPFRAPVMQI